MVTLLESGTRKTGTGRARLRHVAAAAVALLGALSCSQIKEWSTGCPITQAAAELHALDRRGQPTLAELSVESLAGGAKSCTISLKSWDGSSLQTATFIGFKDHWKRVSDWRHSNLPAHAGYTAPPSRDAARTGDDSSAPGGLARFVIGLAFFGILAWVFVYTLNRKKLGATIQAVYTAANTVTAQSSDMNPSSPATPNAQPPLAVDSNADPEADGHRQADDAEQRSTPTLPAAQQPAPESPRDPLKSDFDLLYQNRLLPALRRMDDRRLPPSRPLLGLGAWFVCVIAWFMLVDLVVGLASGWAALLGIAGVFGLAVPFLRYFWNARGRFRKHALPIWRGEVLPRLFNAVDERIDFDHKAAIDRRGLFESGLFRDVGQPFGANSCLRLSGSRDVCCTFVKLKPLRRADSGSFLGFVIEMPLVPEHHGHTVLFGRQGVSQLGPLLEDFLSPDAPAKGLNRLDLPASSPDFRIYCSDAPAARQLLSPEFLTKAGRIASLCPGTPHFAFWGPKALYAFDLHQKLAPLSVPTFEQPVPFGSLRGQEFPHAYWSLQRLYEVAHLMRELAEESS